MIRRLRQLVSGLAALALTVAIAVGIPAGLVTFVGWPLPTAWPTLEQLTRLGQTGVSDTTIIKLLAVIIWVAWAQLTIALLVEMAAGVRGRAARTIRLLPGLQPLAARLVAAIALVAATSATPRLATAELDTVAVNAAVATMVDVADTTSISPSTPARAESATPTTTVTTSARDSWWRLAETHLGDGLRWREIRDLNVGRTVDGMVIALDTDRLEAGWPLLVPAGDTPPAADNTPTTDEEQAGEWQVQPGDHFWGIAEHTLTDAWGRAPTDAEIVSYWRQLIDVNVDRLLPPGDPDLIYPDQRFVIPPPPADPSSASSTDNHDPAVGPPAGDPGPGVEAGQPEVLADPDSHGQPSDAEPAPGPPSGLPLPHPLAPQADTRPPGISPNGGPSQPAVEQPIEEPDRVPDGDTVARVGTIFSGLGLVAAGVTVALWRLRSARLRRRPTGTAPPPPAAGDKTEPQLHAAADPDSVRILDLLLRDLASQLDPNDPPQMAGVHVTTTTLTVLLEHPAHAPAGWEAADEGWAWVRHLEQVEEASLADAHHHPAPLPALVTIGHQPHGVLLLDLEQLTVTELHGREDDVAATMATMAVELATSPLADDLRIVWIGPGGDLPDFARIDTIDPSQLDDLAAELTVQAEEIEMLVVDRPTAAPALSGRLGGVADSWAPTIVLDPTGTAAPLLAELARRTPRGGLGVLTGNADVNAGWQLEVDTDRIRLRTPQQLDLARPRQRANLTGDQLAGISRLVADAKHSADVTYQDLTETIVTHPNGPTGATPDPDLAATASRDVPVSTASSTDTEGSAVEVRVLGTIRVEGADRDFRRAKASELVVYLALHRRGVAADTLMEALWPNDPPDNARLNRVTSDARTALGLRDDGHRHLPRVEADGLYQVADSVACDLDGFQRLVQTAKTEPPEQARSTLRTALGLVEGEPFTGSGTGYGWAYAQGHVHAAVVAIDEAARTLGELCLGVDDHDGARWAATRGLIGCPGSVRLYAIRMRAAAAAGDQIDLRATMAEAEACFAADDGPEADTTVPAELTDLYEQLRGRRLAV